MIGPIIYTALSTASAVTAYVSSRIYPVIIPQEIQGDAIAYALINNLPDETKSGASTLDTYTFEVYCVSSVYANADGMSVAVRNALETLQNTNGIQSTKYQTERDDWDQGSQRFIRILQFKMRKTR